jgi:ligand-binding sensor domain-containing protein/signal transduction histidine kinase
VSSLPVGFLLVVLPLQGAALKLPMIEGQDLRLVRIKVGGEQFRTWTRAIAQDNHGFIWLGTDDGLFRYDGYALKAYRHDSESPHSLSENTIKAIYTDRDGILWIGTGYGGLNRFDPAQDNFTRYRHDPGDGRSLSGDIVSAIYRDGAAQLWVGTNAGLDRLDTSGHFVHYPYEDPARAGVISVIYGDRQGQLWIGSTTGLFRLAESGDRISLFGKGSNRVDSPANDYVSDVLQDHAGILWLASVIAPGLSALNPKTGEFKRYSFNSEEYVNRRIAGVSAIREDRNGALWLATFRDGLVKLDRARTQFTRYSTKPNNLFPDAAYGIFEDAEGNIWVASNEGVCRFQGVSPSFVTFQHEPRNPNSLYDNQVLSVHADADGVLWVGTSGGLHRLDRKSGKVVLYQHNPSDPGSLSDNEVSSIIEDGSGGLWIGTHGGGLDRLDRASGRFQVYRHNPKDPDSLHNDLVQCLARDRDGVIWIGLHNGGIGRFDPKTGHFKAYRRDPLHSRFLLDDNVREILVDGSGILWIGTNGGLHRFDPQSEQFTQYSNDPRDPSSLSHNSIGSIYEDRQGTLWIGTRNGLDRLDRTRGIFEIFTTKNGLANDAIEAIREDGHGSLWLATHQGLSKFEPRTRTVHNYSEWDGLAGDFVNPTGEDRSCVTPNGELVFGSLYGVTAFHPDHLVQNPYVPPVVLTDLRLFGKPVTLAANSPLHEAISATSSLRLSHKQSIFTLEFSALSYVAPERNRYRYRLEDLDPEWNEVDSTRRSATYTSLPAGDYIFRVQGSNNDLTWNEAGVQLHITVIPPWWATWWFRGIALISLASLTYAGYRTRVQRLQATAYRLEAQVTQRTHELQVAKDAADAGNRAKGKFLAHMSHELRNPLSSILGISNLLRESDASEEQRGYLDLIDRSSEHLLTLIDDVLDVAKIEAGKHEVIAAPCDLTALGHEVTEIMRLKAESKKLSIVFAAVPGLHPFVLTDAQKLRQVLINLLSNAIKFTDSGAVALRVSTTVPDHHGRLKLRFEVEDTGMGIAPDDQARIYEPFVQVGRPGGQKGTGLGLTITRQFVEMKPEPSARVHRESTCDRNVSLHGEGHDANFGRSL